MSIEKFATLDALIEPMLQAARIPGAAIAIVAGGETGFSRGYGYRDLAAKLPMTSRTLYPIGSTTKAINATVLGMLVDEGLLAWDAPVQNYLPQLRMRDAAVSAQVTLRDLIVMRTGLPRHDWVWTENSVRRAELAERLRHLESSAGFRERFQYNNMTVTIAGHVAELVTGQSWNDLVRQHLLEPLDMNVTRFTLPSDGEATRDRPCPKSTRHRSSPALISRHRRPTRPMRWAGSSIPTMVASASRMADIFTT
jgi:CubicO group peptidase (beta-lactamase class C family)